MSRKQTGQLIWREGLGWYGRFYATVEGERVRVARALGTDNKQVAARRLRRLIEQGNPSPAADDVTREETFQEAATRIVSKQKIATVDNRAQRLRDYAFDEIGNLPVSKVTTAHVRNILNTACEMGRSHQTIDHIRKDVAAVFRDLMLDELVTKNPASGIPIPEGAESDDRPRIVLSDPEFLGFDGYCLDTLGDDWSTDTTLAELYTMAWTSRSYGGQRNSDLHAWAWPHVDLVNWFDAAIPRPKTKRKGVKESKGRQVLPDQLVPILRGMVGAQRTTDDRPGVPGPAWPSGGPAQEALQLREGTP